MSQFKYCIFVFLVLNSFLSFPQQIEDDVEIRRNEIAFKISDTKLKIQNGNFDVALKNLENLLSETEKINDKKSQAIVLSNFSDLYLATENIESAETYIFKAISIQNNIDDPLNLAISRFIHGKIKFKKLEFKTALDLFNSSRTIFKEQGLDKMYVEATFKVAKTLIELNKLNEAKIVVIKSTITPGTVAKWNKQYKNVSIVFNPEFLTEANAVNDFENQNRIILGGPRKGTTKLKTVYSKVFPKATIVKTDSGVLSASALPTN